MRIDELKVLALIAAAGTTIGIGTPALAQDDVGVRPAISAVNGTTLYLRAGPVDTSAGRQGLAALAGPASAGRQFVIQLDGPITPARRARLEQAGVWIGDYLPMYAYIVRLDRADPGMVAALEFIRWFEEFQEAWKRAPELGRPPVTPELAAVAARGRTAVVVTLFATLTPDEQRTTQRAVWALPGVTSHWEQDVAGCLTMSVEVRPQDVGRLARLPGVQFVEPAPELAPRNDTTRWIVQSNQVNVTPLWDAGLRGEGQVVGILDTRVDSNHCSFSDTAPIGPTHRKILAYNTSLGASSHGTHVAGTAVGEAGNATATRGIAYLGKLVFNLIPAFNETAVVTSLTTHHNQGARIHTNSWGNDGTTAYDSLCRGFDAFNWNNEDDLVCLAVTNTSTLKNPENAKNLLAVGNSQDAPNQANHCTGGTGPTSDGRRKPEVYAPGCSTNSAASGSACGLTSLTGTSMASPAVAGVGMLIRQYFTDGFYPTGTPVSANSFTPTGALLKGMLINSAVDMTGISGYPSNQEGWGRILADNAVHFFGQNRRLLVEDIRHTTGLSTGQEVLLPLNVLGSGERLQVTLVWMEPPASAGASFAAINDLDLVVEGPGGVFLGNVFSGGVSVTGGTKDDRNNVEQVHLTGPAVGAYTVRIKGANVAQGTQGYAIVVSGDIQAGEPPALVINLPGGTPGLIPPGVPTDIDVQVLPGSQGVQPGTPALLYRFSSGASYTSIPLAHLGGTSYRGTLPAASCTDQPEFYFRAEGDGGAVALVPSNAPTNVFSSTVGVLQTQTVLEEGFEVGLPPGWTSSGLWNLTTQCGTAPACQGSQWAYYGQVATCNYATGSTANSGSLTRTGLQLPAIPPGGSIALEYCSALETENNQQYDRAEVVVNGTVLDRAAESSAWQTRSVDLTAFAGQTVSLAWRFETGDGVLNNFRGWRVDDVRIKVTGLVCQSTCYADCNGDGQLNLADFGCFQTKFALGDPYADCNGDGALNLADFGCFQTKFAVGCP